MVSRKKNQKIVEGPPFSRLGLLLVLFSIPFGVSGPRPVQEASVFTAENVPAGSVFQDRDERSLHCMLQAHEVLRSRELQESAGIAPGPGVTGTAKRIPSSVKSGKVLCRTAYGLCLRDVFPLHGGQSLLTLRRTHLLFWWRLIWATRFPLLVCTRTHALLRRRLILGNKVPSAGVGPDAACSLIDLGRFLKSTSLWTFIP